MTYAILFIGVVLFLGQVFSSLFEKTRLPDVLPLMVLGMIIGPILKIVTPDSFGQAGQIFTTLALIVVLFKSGIDFKISSLRGAVGQGLLLTTVCFVFIMVGIAYASRLLLGVNPILSFIIGAIVADNSTAVITPMLAKLNISDTSKTILFLEANLTGVYSIIIALALLSLAVKGGTLSAGNVSWMIFRSFAIGIGFSLIAGVFWMGVLNLVRRLENAISLTFAFVLLVYSVSELIGGDGAIATLTFGIVAGNIRLIRRVWFNKLEFIELKGHALKSGEKDFFDEVEFIFKTLFFVYMGIAMRIGRVDLVFYGALLALVKLVMRVPAVNYCVGKSISRSDCSVMLAMCPNGLVSAVLAAMIAQQLPGEGAVLQDVIYSVIFFTVIFSNFMSFRIEKGGLVWLGETAFKRHADVPMAAAAQDSPAADASEPAPTQPGEEGSAPTVSGPEGTSAPTEHTAPPPEPPADTPSAH